MLNAWIVGILGLWTALSAFLGFAPMGFAWSNWIVGVIAAIAALSMVGRKPVQGWLAGLVAVWLFISGFIPGLRMSPGYWWNDLLVGAAFIVLGFSATAREPSGHGHHHPHEQAA